jgi:Lanthionine synthetase C-like protein/Protein kinase domain
MEQFGAWLLGTCTKGLLSISITATAGSGGLGFVDRQSFFAAARRDDMNGHGADSELIDLVHAGLQRRGAGAWQVQVDGLWCSVRPPAHRWREQGWKLHVSAIPASAKTVLERALDVLVQHRCAFKFASTWEFVLQLNSRHYPRGSGGKFLTAYPDNDEHLRRVAEDLDRATAGLPGPTILSDRPYRPGSLVHYRYGGFVGRAVLSNDSDYRQMIVGPDGSLVEDRRDAWFNPPAWAPSPFDESDPVDTGTGTAPHVLLADRYVVRQAIRHTNKGGVYLANDTVTDTDVIIKEGRPYVETVKTNGAHWDARDMLRREAHNLDVLEPLGVAPRKLDLFEQGGHLFLAEELVSGIPLRIWMMMEARPGPGLSWPLASVLVRRLAELLEVVHGAGLVLRDLTPANVMVTGDGGLRIVDLELAVPPGAHVVTSGTPGYVAPEHLAGAAPAEAADLYSLGAIVFAMVTSTDPNFLEDQPMVRSVAERVAYWVGVAAEHNEAAKRLEPLVGGLMAFQPEHRWSLKRVLAFLDEQERTPASALPRARGSRHLLASDLQRLAIDGLEYLLASMIPDATDRLWPPHCGSEAFDPCNVNDGAAGIVSVLTLAARLHDRAEARTEARTEAWGDTPDFGERLREAIRTACAWIERRVAAEPKLLPGLHFGRAGTAWALFDAARLLDDEPMAQRALALAKRIPTSWPNPDVTHGVAGAGLAQLYFWQATGDPCFREGVRRCADDLVATADRKPSGVSWTVPTWFDSRFAGSTHYGFAHGAAGIGWFLLAAGLATGRQEYRELAQAAGETLSAVAQRDDDGGAAWPLDPGDEKGGWLHWCHGSSGIGTFLIRLWQATGDHRFRELAELAAVAVLRGRWQASAVVCHGLAGNGEFLLDVAAALDEPRYHAWAEELAVTLFAQHAYREGRIVVPDDTGTGLAVGYGVGLAGVVAFLLRLRHGGPRMWMADPESLPAAVGATR